MQVPERPRRSIGLRMTGRSSGARARAVRTVPGHGAGVRRLRARVRGQGRRRAELGRPDPLGTRQRSTGRGPGRARRAGVRATGRDRGKPGPCRLCLRRGDGTRLADAGGRTSVAGTTSGARQRAARIGEVALTSAAAALIGDSVGSGVEHQVVGDVEGPSPASAPPPLSWATRPEMPSKSPCRCRPRWRRPRESRCRPMPRKRCRRSRRDRTSRRRRRRRCPRRPPRDRPQLDDVDGAAIEITALQRDLVGTSTPSAGWSPFLPMPLLNATPNSSVSAAAGVAATRARVAAAQSNVRVSLPAARQDEVRDGLGSLHYYLR